MDQAPVEPVSQHTMSDSMIQPTFPQTSATQHALGSAVEVALAVDPSITLSPLSSQQAAASPSESAPSFTLALDNQTVSCGDAAVFTVLFEGQPRPCVQWYVDGQLVHCSGAVDDSTAVVGVDGVEIVEDLERGTSTLTVLSTTVTSEAHYTCRLHNSRGTAFSNAHLFVIG